MGWCCGCEMWQKLWQKDAEEVEGKVAASDEACTAEGTQEVLLSNSEYLDAREVQRPEDLDARILEIGRTSCAKLKEQAFTSDSSWNTWSSKGGLRVEYSKKAESKTISGRGIYEWLDPPAELDIDFIKEVMWTEDTKKRYDANTDSMVCFFTVDDDTNLTCQAFKGRFGFSGRYFHVVIHKDIEREEDCDRLVLGARSIDEELLPSAHDFIDREEAARQLAAIERKFVRGFAFVAGIIIELVKRPTRLIRIIYVNDADIVTTGVPQWIIDRVKIDQLSVVKNVPAVLADALKERALDIDR